MAEKTSPLRLRPVDVMDGPSQTMRREDQERSDQQAAVSPRARTFATAMTHFQQVEHELAVERDRADALERGHNILSAENAALRSQLSSERDQYRTLVTRLTGERDVLARHVHELVARMRTTQETLESLAKGISGAVREAALLAYKPKPRASDQAEESAEMAEPATGVGRQPPTAMLRNLETAIAGGSEQPSDG